MCKYLLMLLVAVTCVSGTVSAQEVSTDEGIQVVKVDTTRFRGKTSFSDVVKEAIRQGDIPVLQKLRLRLVMAVKPEAKQAVEEYFLQKVNEEGEMSIASVDTMIDLDNLERLLQILIKYLPDLIAIFIELFSFDMNPNQSLLVA